jgi:hypothetical protein
MTIDIIKYICIMVLSLCKGLWMYSLTPSIITERKLLQGEKYGKVYM